MTFAKRRSGYTLIEILVVMSLMAILAAIAIMFFPSAASSQVESRAAMQLQTWLNAAKQRAVHDQAPRGLRLIVSDASQNSWWPGPAGTPYPNVVVECQFLEQPDDFSGGTLETPSPLTFPPNLPPGYSLANTLQYKGVDPMNGIGLSVPPTFFNLPDPNVGYWSVQPQPQVRPDKLELMGGGLMYDIVQIGLTDNNNKVYPQYIVVRPDLTNAISKTANYRIVRSPRAVGDQTLKMPSNTLIDLSQNLAYPSPLPGLAAAGTQVVDILFSPTGAVISPGLTVGNLNLWVRAPDSTNATDPFRGDPTVISVFVNTGFVGAYPVGRAPLSPWALVQ